NQIRSSKGCRRRVTDRYAGHLVDLGRCEPLFKHFVNGRHHPECTDPICDEIRAVLCGHDTFSQTLIKKTRDLACDLAAGFRSGYHLDKFHVSRRIEKMNANKMLLEI